MILSYHAVPTEEEMFFIGSALVGGFFGEKLMDFLLFFPSRCAILPSARKRRDHDGSYL